MKKILTILCLCLTVLGVYFVLTQPRRKEQQMWDRAIQAAEHRAEQAREKAKVELKDLLDKTL